MYHIKADKRSQSSAAEIVRGMQECLKTMPLKSITVSDIHRVTGISRATFYRLFDNPEDVLIYQLEQMTEASLDAADNGGIDSSRKLLEATIALGLQNHEFLRALVENGRLDLLFRYTERSYRRLNARNKILPKEMDPAEQEYVIAHLSMSMVASQITWSRNGQKESPQDLLRYLERYTRVVAALLEE